MLRLLLPLVLLLSVIPAFAQQDDDGRLYNPPSLEMRGWLDRSLRTQRQRRNDAGGMTDMTPPEASSIIVVERKATQIVQPLLPIIFFNVGESRFPPRYRLIGSPAISGGYEDTTAVSVKMSESTFGEDPALMQRVGKYYELLDIVGCRMRRYPDARLKINGDYSGEPGENPDLARLRAVAVRDHLVTMWGISPERINLLEPHQACAAGAPMLRQEEARHVVILCDDPRVLQPVRFDLLAADEMMLNLQFTVIPRFDPHDIRDMELSVGIGDALVYRGSLPISPDSSVYRFHGVTPIMWAVDDPSVLREQIVSQVVITLNDGRRFLSNQSKLAFTERRTPSIERSASTEFELPYFDWRDTTITELQAPMFALMVSGLDSALSATRLSEREMMERMDEAERQLDSAVNAADRRLDAAHPEEGGNVSERRVEAEDDVEPPIETVAIAPETTANDSGVIVGDSAAAEATVPDSEGVDAVPYEVPTPPERRLVSTTPRLMITTSTDPTEGFDLDISPYLSAKSEEPWRDMGSIVLKPLLDRANPPRLLLVDGEEVDDKVAQMTWLGFDVEDQLESMMTEQRARMEKVEQQDTALFSDESPAYTTMQERMQNLARGRVEAVHAILLRAGFGDTMRVHIRVDTSGPGFMSGITGLRLSVLGASGFRLPERRYAARMVTVTINFDPEYEYDYDVNMPKVGDGDRVQSTVTVDAPAGTGEGREPGNGNAP